MTRARFIKTQLLAATALGLVSAFGFAGAAYASGFGLREGAADSLGNAFVGGEAKAYGASTAWSNPAGMALLTQDELSGNISYIAPKASFSGSNTDPLTGTTVNGVTGGNAVAPAATGALFAVFALDPDWRLGFSVTNPYGERTAYPLHWVGRYQSLVSSITAIDFSPSLSYRVSDQFSIGGGPVFEYFHARLTQAINTPFGAATSQDPLADIHGSNVGVGYNLGALYQINSTTRVGLDYHSRIRHNISGTQSISIPSIYYALTQSPDPEVAGGATEAIGMLNAQNSPARTSVTLPDSIGASIYNQVTPALAVMASLQWTHWSLFNQLHVTPSNGAPGTTIVENWRNSWFGGVGANYQVNSRLMLQTGFAIDQSPVTAANRTSRVPDSEHYDVGFGAKYQISPNTSFEVAYAHVFAPSGDIHNSASASAGTQIGSYDVSDNSLTVGITTSF